MSRRADFVFEVFRVPNPDTASGEPPRWQWKGTDADGVEVDKSRHSFKTDAKAIADIELHAVIPAGAILRRPGFKDLALECDAA